jgi:hypothetical protein
MKRFSEMSLEEIQQAIEQLVQEQQQAASEGWQSKADMISRKIDMAKSYILNPDDFAPGLYNVTGYSDLFELKYINGVMGWGAIGHESEVSFPLSMLSPVEKP